jgi:hypothetical protein
LDGKPLPGAPPVGTGSDALPVARGAA